MTWCVWSKIPRAGQASAGRKEGWSRVAGGLTQDEAQWFAEKIFFQARAMPDAMPGHVVPVTANPSDVGWIDDDEGQG